MMMNRDTYIEVPNLRISKRGFVNCFVIGWRIISTHFNTKRERKFLKEKIAWAFYFQNFTATTTIKIAAAMPTPAFICGVQKEEDKTEPPLDKTDKGIYANISAPCIGLGLTKDLTCGSYLPVGSLGVNGSASITSPAFQEYVRRPTTPPTATLVEYGFEKVYLAIVRVFCGLTLQIYKKFCGAIGHFFFFSSTEVNFKHYCPIAGNGYGFAMFAFLPLKNQINKKANSDKADVTSSRDYLAEILLRRTKEKKKKCEAGLLKNFCQF